MVRDGAGRLIALALLLTVVAVPAASAAAPLVGAQIDPDSVLLRANLHPDGSATWHVEYRILLDDENTTEAFESFAADIERNRSEYVDRFADRMNRTVASAENATGREMAVRNVSVRTDRVTLAGPQKEYGVVTYSLRWEGFAAVEGDRLAAGDALAGLFLDADTSLIVSWPAEYRLVEAAPATDESRENAVVWNGRVDFGQGEPRVIVTAAPPTTTTAGTSPGTGGGPTDGGPSDGRQGGLPGTLLGVGALAVLAAVGAAGWLYTRRGGDDGPVAASGDGGSGDGGDGGAAAGGEPPEDLLSNEERVLRLLEEHGGRVKQQQVAEKLDWTDAKTSQVVGDLREAGEIESFRLGRENVLSLPDEDDI